MRERLNRLFGNRWAQRCAMALLAGAFLFLLRQTWGECHRLGTGYDFPTYLASARALARGADPYHTSARFPYIYPLFLAFALIPLSVLPYWLPDLLWFCASVASLLIGSWVLVGVAAPALNTARGRHVIVPGVVLIFLLLLPIQHNLLCGQVNLIVLACCVMFLRSFTRAEPRISALWLAAAISIKLWPAAFLLFALIRRQYRIALYTLVFTALFCFLPALLVGKKVFAFYGYYVESVLVPWFFGPSVAQKGVFVFTLDGIIRHAWPSVAGSAWARVASLVVGLGSILAVEAVVARSPKLPRDVWAFCAYLIGCALISPLAWTHHLTLIIPAVVLMGLKVVFDEQWATKGIVALFACFLACFVVIARIVSPFFFVSLVLLLVLVGLAGRVPSVSRVSAT